MNDLEQLFQMFNDGRLWPLVFLIEVQSRIENLPSNEEKVRWLQRVLDKEPLLRERNEEALSQRLDGLRKVKERLGAARRTP